MHHRLPFARHWGDGATSSSDGQAFPISTRRPATATINAKYGRDPTVTFYTHVSDQYSPFHTKVINSTVRDALYAFRTLSPLGWEHINLTGDYVWDLRQTTSFQRGCGRSGGTPLAHRMSCNRGPGSP